MKQFSKDLGNVSLAPKGKWSREQEYERLALVYNACDNLSYVAKINVPSGVEIDKTSILQEAGDAEDKVMSQGAVKAEFGKKFDKESVVVRIL